MKQEMKRMKIDILGMSEVRWTGVGVNSDEDLKFIYSGGDEHQRDVGMMMKKEVAKCVMGYWAVSDRILLVKFAVRPLNICVIQVYAPTGDHHDEEIEEFYEMLTQVKNHCKAHDITIVMGDINAKVGRIRHEKVVGPFGFGEKQ